MQDFRVCLVPVFENCSMLVFENCSMLVFENCSCSLSFFRTKNNG